MIAPPSETIHPAFVAQQDLPETQSVEDEGSHPIQMSVTNLFPEVPSSQREKDHGKTRQGPAWFVKQKGPP